MAAPMLSAQFADAVQPRSATGVIRVAVRNGAGVTGLSDAARQRLEAVGMHYVGGGNADSFGHAASEVLVPTGSPADRQRGEQVATALGLSPVTVIVGDQPSALSDVTVVLGRDFADDVTARGVLPTMTP